MTTWQCDHPAAHIVVEGHTDRDGTAAANERLADERAASVKAWFVDKGVPEADVRAVGHGETRPVAPNDTRESKALNRRCASRLRADRPAATGLLGTACGDLRSLCAHRWQPVFMHGELDAESWLREQCSQYEYDLRGVLRTRGDHTWPLTALDEADLEQQLVAGGHVLPLPKEPASLANVLEVSIVDFLLRRAGAIDGAEARRGTERGYPDIELSGQAFGGGYHAIDVKIARRGLTKKGTSSNTQSRITLYTGNTYFKYPSLHWPGTFRPFDDYRTHLDVLGIYTLNEDASWRVDDLELIVQQPWRIGSRQRSSTTREYIGAVTNIEALRQGRGEFETPQAFYSYWRKYPFRIGRAVSNQLAKLLLQQSGSAT